MLVLILMLALSQPPALRVTISNVAEARGSILVAVFREKTGFPDAGNAFHRAVVPVKKAGSVTIEIPDAPPGPYAISCFHDLNNNGKLDKNLMGIPTEPYAFSNGARPKFRAPNWEEARVEWPGAGGALQLRLESW